MQRVIGLLICLFAVRVASMGQNWQKPDPISYQSTLEICDAVTEEPLGADIGATITVICRYSSWLWKNGCGECTEWPTPIHHTEISGDVRWTMRYSSAKIYGIFSGRNNDKSHPEYVELNSTGSESHILTEVVSYQILVQAAGYEDARLEQVSPTCSCCTSGRGFEVVHDASIYSSPRPEYEYGLYPTRGKELKIYMVRNRGERTIESKVHLDSGLGVYTSSEIAKQLGVSDEEIVKLIQSKKLKGKKIGDKYFVKKDDFLKFMDRK